MRLKNFTTKTWILVTVAVIITMALIVGAYSLSKTKENKADSLPVQSVELGVVDTSKVIRYHPEFEEYKKLQAEYQALTVKAEEEFMAGIKPAPKLTYPVADKGRADIYKEKQDAKLKALQEELRLKLNEKAQELKVDLNKELEAFIKDIDDDYLPEIFNLQLKLKIVQLTQEELKDVQDKLAKLNQERAEKIAAQDKKLKEKFDELIVGLQAELDKQYYEQAIAERVKLEQELAQQPAASSPKVNDEVNDISIKQKIGFKEQEIRLLEGKIMSDMKAKIGLVATENGLTTVIMKPMANVSAMDITDMVIAKFK